MKSAGQSFGFGGGGGGFEYPTGFEDTNFEGGLGNPPDLFSGMDAASAASGGGGGGFDPTSLLMMLGAAVIGGIGQGISAKEAAKAQRDAEKERNLGPVRGGTSRSGNPMSISPIERIGQTAMPLRTPAYGQPLDLNELFKPAKFGTGFAIK